MLNRHFSKENLPVANKHAGRCLTASIIKEMQIRTAVRYHFISMRMVVKSSFQKCYWASLVAMAVKNPPAMWETWVQSWVGKTPCRRVWQSTPLFLPGESPRTEKPGELQSIGPRRVRNDERLSTQVLDWKNVMCSDDELAFRGSSVSKGMSVRQTRLAQSVSFFLDHQQGHTIPQMHLCWMLCSSLDGRGSLRENGHIYMYGWVPSLIIWNYHTASWLQLNTK